MPTNPHRPPIRPPHPLAHCLPETRRDLAIGTAAPANSAAWQSRHPALMAIASAWSRWRQPSGPFLTADFSAGSAMAAVSGWAVRRQPARPESQGRGVLMAQIMAIFNFDR